jgi:hypothetical protein
MEGSLVAFKVFTNGSTLPASDVNDFLMRQTVMTFADATARSAAITAPTEGMVTYLEDNNSYQSYDGSAWVGVVPQSPNAIINGAFDIWQRGTSFTAVPVYTSDRWYFVHPTGATLSRQTSGLEGFNFSCRVQRDSGNSLTTGRSIRQNLETIESIPFQNKNITFSFYAKAGANYSAASNGLVVQVKSGTGTNQNSASGFTGEVNLINQTVTLTTSWQRFTVTGTVPSNSTQLSPVFISVPTGTAGANDWFEITGVQLEAGSVATPFRRNANSLQDELAACQRYYWRWSNPTAFLTFQPCFASSTSAVPIQVRNPVQMRVAATSIDNAGIQIQRSTDDAQYSNGTWTLNGATPDHSQVVYTHGSSVFTAREQLNFRSSGTGGSIAFSAEL